MPARFFLDEPPDGDAVRITGDLAAHIARSLRIRAGDAIVAVRDGIEFGVSITAAGRVVEGVVTWSRPASAEPVIQVTLVQALPRERMEDCVDVAVQAGVALIMPVHTERTVSRPDPHRATSRVRRWNAVAREAAQLAGRGRIPEVRAPLLLSDALAELAPVTQVIACTSALDAGAPPRALAEVDVSATRPVAVVIGPEGGLGDRDIAALDAAGASRAHLGPRVLRTRYAGAVATALLLARSGDLDAALAPAPS